MNIESIGNVLEAGLWFLIGTALAVRAWRSQPARLAKWVLPGAFVLFGISDLIEAQTGAWWRPSWLLVLKLSCVMVFVAALWRYYQSQFGASGKAMSSHGQSTAALGDERSSLGLSRAVAAFAILWLAWAVLLADAMVLGNRAAGHGSSEAVAARMASSVVLAAAGWLAAFVWRNSPTGRFSLTVALGMTLGTIGDFFNAGLLGFVPLPDPVLGGILAFGLGHVAYIAGCVDLARRTGLTSRRSVAGAVIAWQVVGLVGWVLVALLGSEARGLVWPALPYSLLLAGTAGIATGLAAQQPRLASLAIGAALFLASDLILAFELFRGPFAHDTECVWLTYGPGQMLIVFSTLAAARLTSTGDGVPVLAAEPIGDRS